MHPAARVSIGGFYIYIYIDYDIKMNLYTASELLLTRPFQRFYDGVIIYELL
jgi:hypothetical protein